MRFQGVLDQFGVQKGKHWAKATKYAGCTFSQWHFRSLLRSYLAEVRDQIKKNKCRRILEKENYQKECKTNLECRKVKCEANRNKNRQTQLILCSAAMDEVKREVRIISSVSYYFSLSNIIKSHIIWQALTLFLLLTLLLLGYNQETV